MPRSRPFQCHQCGTLYTGGHCPKCHPKRGKSRGGWWASRSRGRTTAAQVLGRDALPVDVGAVSDGDREGVEAIAIVERPADRTCATGPEQQAQEPDRGAAGSSGPPPDYDED
jgi:hypothetical protein